MKKNIYKLLPFLFLFALVSCEEVVQLDLNSIEPKLVIDASITEGQPCIVNLTKTQDIDNNNTFDRVSGAIITISYEDGHTETLNEDTQGRYLSLRQGVVGEKYVLKVTSEGKSYQSQATIPDKVPIDSMYIFSVTFGTDPLYSPAIIYNDPAGVPNFFYSRVTVNDRLLRTIYLDSDEFNDGVPNVTNILFFNQEDNNNERLKIGDKVKVDFQTLDQGSYHYFLTLFSVAAGGATNPISNFTGGVLGCFKAYNVSSKEIVISEDNIHER